MSLAEYRRLSKITAESQSERQHIDVAKRRALAAAFTLPKTKNASRQVARIASYGKTVSGPSFGGASSMARQALRQQFKGQEQRVVKQGTFLERDDQYFKSEGPSEKFL